MSAADETDGLWPPPRANPDLLGQEQAETQLAAVYAAGRAAHAWLFNGPKGIGKATLAFRLVRWLFRQGTLEQARVASLPAAADLFGAEPPRPASSALFIDPGDPVFRRVASGGHADLFTLEPGVDPKRGTPRTEISVAEVRAASTFLAATAAEGGWRAVIVDPAEAMNRNAANALLKTLEEPPRGTVLILISHAPGMLPATVRSRCRRVTLAPLATPTIAELLQRYRPETTADEAAVLARLARGSIGHALRLASGEGERLRGQLTRLFRVLPAVEPLAVLDLGEAAKGQGAGEGGFALLADLLRAWLASIVRVAGGAQPQEALATEAETIGRLAAAGGLERWLQVWDNATRLLARAETANMDVKQVVLAVFLNVEAALKR